MVRFYENKYPELVMVQVQSIEDMGAYVKLLEYDGIEGMILLSELSRRRIRSVQKLIRVGRNEVVVVMRVDPDKGYIDLSKRRVSAEEVVKCEEQYEKGRAVDSILTQVAKRRNVPTESLYEQIAWPLQRKYGHAYEAFKLSIQEPEVVFGPLEIEPDTLAELKHTIARRLTPKPVKVRADIEVRCFAYNGIEAIRKALKAGEALSTEAVPIKVRLVAPPLYVMSTTSTDKSAAIETMEKAVEAINQTITEEKGDMLVKMAPKVVSETEDAELKALMEEFEQANMDVAGDDDSDEED
ncbi:eukaryotic translation initiation factor 2 subunit alpha [Trichosporon asahii var. asahii CBS 8904]|uniref:Eukaryotic translation initiation factor 2 subunit alpha n=2 Tax=Trichosporon asahii var. asahii TaxID=189963 RepID=K1VQT0_TRIAC|nr:eukaryotic translation initiation factor 2 subunit alpha [Trichosporon asahii var. asahii CBS 2479]EJT48465.1 eukaryotic translation initiation factor 2 subunit alpha [Trichosporon asahii var. asahii CBS 2479]EKC99092.1 eukaryotic translation initiation factor 2 subunit alpha [Trichosporon asahii var. asahii CBS 8904]